MTLEWIIEVLSNNSNKDNENIKEALKNASYMELCELRRSISQKINIMCGGELNERN